MNFNKLNDLTKRFLVSEGISEVNINGHIQLLGDLLEKLTPRSQKDKNSLDIAKNHLLEIRRKTRRLNNKVQMLEERVKLLEENNS
mgnify:CR=1 FL=1